MESTRKAWANTREDAALGLDVVPHCLRHSTAFWGMQYVETVQELQALGDFLGMSLKMLLARLIHESV